MKAEMINYFRLLLAVQLVVFLFMSMWIAETRNQQQLMNELLEQDMIEYCVDINSIEMEEDNEEYN